MKSILFVNGNTILCRLVYEILETEGYRPVTATNAADALQLFENQDFDLVITCSCLQGMNCAEFARVVHAKVPELPVIVVTPHATQDTTGAFQGCVAADEGLFPALMDKIRLCLQESERRLVVEGADE